MPELVQQVTLSCPICNAPVSTEVYSLIDVGREPELKGKLLRGRINVARCANCGGEGVLATPILYHDPEHELLLAFIPPEMDLADEEKQRIIGDLTNIILSYLPPEQRKGYFLIPKVLLNYQSLLEHVLEAEGVTPDMMEAQRARMELVERLRQMMADEESLKALVSEVDDQLSFEFFATLGAYIETSRQDGQEDWSRELEGLRERLLELSSYGRKLAAQMLGQSPSPPPLSREDLLEKLQAAELPEERVELVAWYRSVIDYQFFQMLTAKIESAEKEGQVEDARRLRDLRETLLEMTERMDEETRAALGQASKLLQQLLDSEEADAFIREHMDEFDDAFFIVLGSNLQAVQESGQIEIGQRLQDLGHQVLQIARESLPPEVRLLRDLLSAPDDEAVGALLREHESLVDENLLALMQSLAGDVEEEEVVVRLRQLAEQTERWLEQQG